MVSIALTRSVIGLALTFLTTNLCDAVARASAAGFAAGVDEQATARSNARI